jgi:hypothetical protein
MKLLWKDLRVSLARGSGWLDGVYGVERAR